MKVVYTSDLHGMEGLYEELHKLVAAFNPDALIIGGDMLPKDASIDISIEDQGEFIRGFLARWLHGLKKSKAQLEIYAMLGNDDWLVNMLLMEELVKKGLVKLLHMKKYVLGRNMEIIGYGNCPPTPFSNKESERIDSPSAPRQPQLYAACISTSQGLKKIEADEYFKSLPTIEEELGMLPQVNDYRKTIFVSHSPPYDCGLDTMHDGERVGSLAIRDFIEKRQPLISLHGHIHEAPAVSNSYVVKIAKTICINPGQEMDRLHAVSFDLDDMKGSLYHTVYGSPSVKGL